MNTDLDLLVTEYNEAKEDFRKRGQVILKKAFKDFFDNNPLVKSVLWAQYTPYFCDGDPCEFGVNEFAFSKTIETIANVDRRDVWGETEVFYTADLNTPELKFNRNMHKLPNDIFESLFGDHVMVLATRKGFDTEEYDHD